jgi:SAM-dependent methyltransferase
MTPAARFQRDCASYHAKQGSRFRLEDGEGRMLYDVITAESVMPTHYFEQDIWAARKIIDRKPGRHVDIGSRVDGFVSHLLAARIPVEFVDIRPLPREVDGLTFIQADATTLEGIPDNSVESLSALHSVEHFGLGRYGDPIDPDGWEKAMHAMARVLAPGGHLYFAVPIGKERVVFNAHRIFDPQTVFDTFSDLSHVSFAAIDDAGNMTDVELNETREFSYGCGMFEFVKGDSA